MKKTFADALADLIAEYQQDGTPQDEICSELELAAMALEDEGDLDE